VSFLADQLADGIGLSRVVGLIGANNAASPTTKFDLTALAVVLRNPENGQLLTKLQPGTLTVDVSLAGPVAGGRDQVAAFTATNFVHIFYIYNPTTKALQLIWSASSSVPVMPDGFKFYCYAATIRYQGASTITAMVVTGSKIYYCLPSASMRVLSNGSTGSPALVSCSTYTPANQVRTIFRCLLQISSATIFNAGMDIYPFGAMDVTVIQFVINVANTAQQGTAIIEIPLDAGQTFKYTVSQGQSGGAYVDVIGYVVPNGDC
jgi:hypothetical protein